MFDRRICAQSQCKSTKKLEPGDSIFDNLMDFAASVPDFRRTDKGNIRHRLEDIIMLMILARASKCVERTCRGNRIRQAQSKQVRKIGLLRNGVPSESTLCRIENGINDQDMADIMQEFAQKYQRGLVKKIPENLNIQKWPHLWRRSHVLNTV